MDLLASLKNQLYILMGRLQALKQEKLYKTAVAFLGRDASPSDLALDNFGCAESLSKVVQAAFPELKFPTLLSTRDLHTRLSTSNAFKLVATPQAGDIILSVTGTGNGRVSNGHTGIMGKNASPDGTVYIMSNDSRTGTWEAAFTLAGWNRYYRDKGGMATLFYRVV